MESTHDRWIAIESFYLSIYYVFIIINDERLYILNVFKTFQQPYDILQKVHSSHLHFKDNIVKNVHLIEVFNIFSYIYKNLR